jgi:muramoyltetrapeptide carboxypeptidase
MGSGPTSEPAAWPRIPPGSRCHLISPAGPVRPEQIERGADVLRDAGFQVTLGAHAHGCRGYLAGTDDERLRDLHEAFADPDVAVVMATRGGFGTQRLLDRLDRELLAGSAALFVGLSDLTALHVVLGQECGKPSLYGSGLSDAGTMPGGALAALRDIAPWSITASPAEPTSALTRGGPVSGRLVGGNLTMLASGLGTRDALRPLPGAVLLLEDVHEAPYRLDRMLLQLARAGTFDSVAGLVLGQFTDSRGRPDQPDAVAVLSDWCDRLGVPVVGGVPVGHGPGAATAPLGLVVRLEGDTVRLTTCAHAGETDQS